MTSSAELAVVLRARDRYSKQLQGFRGGLDGVARSARQAGKVVSIAGAAGALALKSFITSAQAQEIGIRQLDQALKNIGVSYAAVKDEIERVIEAQQRKTNFGDEAQRDALRTLISIGGDYQASLEALPAVLDLAADRSMKLNNAAVLVGKALAGETSSLSRYGIMIEKGSSQTEIMERITRQFAGAAESAQNPLTQMKNRLGDVAQIMGDALLPSVEKAANLVETLARRMQTMNPTVLKTIAIIAGVATAFALVAGPALLLIGFLPAIIAGFIALGPAVTIATGPIGIIIVAIAALVAGGILLWKNWGTIKEKAAELWNFLRPTFETGINFLIGLFNKWTFVYREGLALLLEGAKKVANFFGLDLADGIQTAIDVLRNGVPEIQLAEIEIQKVGKAAETAGQSAGVMASQVDGLGQSTKALTGSTISLGLATILAEGKERTRLALIESLGERIEENARIQKAAADAAIANADREIAARQRVSQTWDDFRFRISDVGEAIRKHGITTQQILQAIADANRVNVGVIIDQLDALGIAANDTEAIIEAFGEGGARAVLKLADALRDVNSEIANLNKSAGAGPTVEQEIRAAQQVRRMAKINDAEQRINQMVGWINAHRDTATAESIAGVQASIARWSAILAELMARPLESFQTLPGQIKVVPGRVNESRIAMVHGGEVIGRPGGGVNIDMRNSTFYGLDDLDRKVAQSIIRSRRLGAEI